MYQQIDHIAINTIRTLAADVVRKANSGHPGMVEFYWLISGGMSGCTLLVFIWIIIWK